MVTYESQRMPDKVIRLTVGDHPALGSSVQNGPYLADAC